MTTERKKLVEDNMNLAKWVAGKYQQTGMDDEDIVSIAFLGLVKAAQSYDKAKAGFASYAIPTIQNEILMCLRKKAVCTVSFNTPIGEGIELKDVLGGDSKELDMIETKVFLSQCMKRLNPTEQIVLREIYYQNKIQSEVAKQLGCSQGSVSRIHHTALSKLRRAYLA